jgi:excisionase family DNA binding protein
VDDYERFLQTLLVERVGGAARAQPHAGSPGARRPRAEPGPDKLLLRVEEAAQVLSVGRTRVYALIGSGELRSVKIGGSRRVPAAVLREYVERLSDLEP